MFAVESTNAGLVSKTFNLEASACTLCTNRDNTRIAVGGRKGTYVHKYKIAIMMMCMCALCQCLRFSRLIKRNLELSQTLEIYQ